MSISRTPTDLPSAMTAVARPVGPALWLKVVLFGVSFWASAEAGQYLSVPGSSYVSFWLPAGIYMAALLLNRTGDWPWFMLSALVANLAFDLPHGTPFLTILGFYCANTVEALMGAWLVRRFVGERPSLETHKEFLGLAFFSAGVSTTAGATIGAATLVASGMSHSYAAAWQTWWCNEALAILLVTPFILSWLCKPLTRRELALPPARVIEAVVLLSGLLIYTWYMLVMDQGIMAPYKSRLMPFLLWASLRFGLRGVSAVNLIFALLMGFLTTHYLVGLTPAQISSGAYVGVIQSFLGISIIMTLIPAIVLNERNVRMKELQESQERLRNLTEASFEAICITENGRILDVNDQGLHMLGYARHEVIGRNLTDCVTADKRALADENIQQGRELTQEYQLIRKDGTLFYAEARARMVRLGDRTLRMTAVRDITERIRASEALRISEEKFRLAMQNSPIGMGMVAPDGRWLEVNPALCKIVGYTPDELVATNFQAITHPDDLDVDVEFVRRMLAREIETYAMEKRYLHKQGHAIWIQLNVSLTWNPDGTPRHFVSQIQDISERKRAQEALQENQAKLMLAMDMARLFHWEYDVTSRQITCDENLLKYHGTSSAELGGVTMPMDDYLRKFIHPDDIATIIKEMERAQAASDSNYTSQFEKRVMRSNGSTGVMLTRFMVVKDVDGHPVKAYGVNQDITEQKQAEGQQKKLEEQLRQAQKMEALGTLAGGTAHEFNNMLGIITGSCELARIELGENHPVQSCLDESLKAAGRAREIVQQILTFSRQQKQSLGPVQIAAVVRDAVSAIRKTLPPSVALHLDIAGDNSLVLGNSTQIHQVLMNICVNAWHAMPNGIGSIWLAQKTVALKHNAAAIHPNLREETYVHLTIRDDGAGMDTPTLRRIFEPFFTTKTQGKGTGLGLAVAHGIMQAHEGAIFAQSEQGRGTTFHLYFPASAKLVPEVVVPKIKSFPRGDGQHILLVDDEPVLMSVAAKFLQRIGYHTTVAGSAASGLDLIQNKSTSFDLVITDLTMPGMNGAELAKALQTMRPDLPIVLASGYGGTEAANNFGAPNIRSFLQKPFTADVLIETVQAVLAKTAITRQE